MVNEINRRGQLQLRGKPEIITHQQLLKTEINALKVLMNLSKTTIQMIKKPRQRRKPRWIFYAVSYRLSIETTYSLREMKRPLLMWPLNFKWFWTGWKCLGWVSKI